MEAGERSNARPAKSLLTLEGNIARPDCINRRSKSLRQRVPGRGGRSRLLSVLARRDALACRRGPDE
eukprot:4173881-Prymnesium_polylepis.1